MKEKFQEYYTPTPKEKKKLWAEATFVFDANVLLNLYRYSEKTRKEFLGVLEKMDGRIWLPHQFALEFQRNRLMVIEEQALSYDSVSANFGKGFEIIKKEVDEYRHRHPFLDLDSILSEISVTIKKSIKKVNNTKSKHPNWFKEDPIRKSLDTLFKDKVGDPCENLEDVCKTGEERFSKDIPPGYKDRNKKDPQDIRKYGDWIGWYQIIEMVKVKKTPIILITSERKEDWWLEVKGKAVGPRPELIKEISQHGVVFYMYTMESFLSYAKPIYKVQKTTVKEIQEVNKKINEDQSKMEIGGFSEAGSVPEIEPSGVILSGNDAGEQTQL